MWSQKNSWLTIMIPERNESVTATSILTELQFLDKLPIITIVSFSVSLSRHGIRLGSLENMVAMALLTIRLTTANVPGRKKEKLEDKDIKKESREREGERKRAEGARGWERRKGKGRERVRAERRHAY